MTDEAVKVHEGHELGWQDDGSARVVACGDVRLERDFTLTASSFSYGVEQLRACPNCGKFLRLVWDVHAEVADPR